MAAIAAAKIFFFIIVIVPFSFIVISCIACTLNTHVKVFCLSRTASAAQSLRHFTIFFSRTATMAVAIRAAALSRITGANTPEPSSCVIIRRLK